MKPKPDEGKRGHIAVAISVVEEDDTYVLFFDDLHLCSENHLRRLWEHKTFVTTAVVPKDKLLTMNFSAKEMAGMGKTILGSLSALYCRPKAKRR
jgi:hypothetical protein